MMTELLIEHIQLDSSGKARIRGTGVAVKMIAELHNLGWTVDELTGHYKLIPAQVHAALSYYYDHKLSIDAIIQAGRALVASTASIDDLRLRIAKRSA